MADVYVSRWPEEQILDYFWSMVGEGANRLALLQQLSGVAVERPATWNTADVRARAAQLTLTADACFACSHQERRLFWHHVIEVQHGGSSSPRNMAALCFECHQAIHPWLTAPLASSTWTSVADLAAATKAGLIEVRMAS